MKIALAGPYPAGTLEQFQALLPDQTFFSVESQEDYEALTDVDCIIVRVLKTPEAILANKPNLKAVIRWGAGYDSVDVQAAGRRGIPVLNTPGVNAYAVAELALGMMITLNRKVLGYWNNVQQGNWDRGAFASLSLNHKTVGIVGGGNIGRRVAALVQALGAQVVYYDAFRLPPEREQELHMTYAPLEELLEQPPQEPPDGGDLQQQVLDRMCQQELARAVQRLEEKYRSPVILMYRFGMGIDEIARIERVPKGTIKSRLSRARKQLRKEMEERGYAQEF